MNPTNRRVGRPKLPPELTGGEACEADEGDASGETAPRGWGEPRSSGSRLGAWARVVAGTALVVAVSASVAYVARRYVTTSPRFAIQEISVSGAHQRKEDDLLARAGIRRGDNVFNLHLEAARARLLEDPWIKEATLARRLPQTVMVQVTEREPAAIVALGESFLASRDGEIFKRLEPGDDFDLPIITGITPEAAADDRDEVTRSIRRALDLAVDYERGPIAHRSPLQEIHFGSDGGITLVVGKSGLSLSLGTPPFRRKLEQAARVLAELDHRGGHAEAILLDNEARPERVVVRMK